MSIAGDSSLQQWLVSRRLERHFKIFVDHGIDLDVLAELQDSHLRELGFSLGDRLRILKEVKGWVSESPGRPFNGLPAVSIQQTAERRQLTVVFVDLVDSTGIASVLDPENLRDLMLAYQGRVAGEITRYKGHVARYMGDGVLAYFGWPQAYEDSVECAVHASLALVDSVSRMSTPQGKPMQTRIGIATGLVVVGDLIGEGAAREESVIGETPNLAARLQILAEPGQVLVSEATRQHLHSQFDFVDHGVHVLKGFPAAVPVFSVSKSRLNHTRFGARDSGNNFLIGREADLRYLMQSWAAARAGTGQLLLLEGEAGIGKSGLVQHLLQSIEPEIGKLITWQCSPHHSDSALFPPRGIITNK